MNGAIRSGLTTWLVAGLLLASAPLVGLTQTPPRVAPPPAQTPDNPLSAEPVDLLTVLQLAAANNLDIAQARAVVELARATRQRVLAQGLPSLSLGATYVSHDGKIQQSNGNILTINRDSLFVGGPLSLSINISDALFAPKVAREAETSSEFGLRRITNETLLQVGEVYLQILQMRRRLARIDDTLDFLIAERPSESRGKSKGLLPLLRDSVEAGGKEALRSDLARVEVEVARRREERAQSVQELRVASSQLARLLRLDPRTTYWPVEDFRRPIAMPGDDWTRQDLEVLVAVALGSRPELAENQALVQAALQRVRQVRYRTYLPYFTTNWSYGGFGGSPLRDPSHKINDPHNGPIDAPITPSGQIDNFGPRTDVDLSLVWRLNGLGLSNAAEVRQQRALRDQAELRLVQVRDLVVQQVVEAYVSVQRTNERLEIAGSALFDAKGEPTGSAFRSIRLNFDRVRGAEGRPFEVLDSIRGFNEILEVYGQAVYEHERAKLRLLIALGLPPRAYFDPASMPPAPK
jgi:outer membrane protein TolC